MKRVLFIVIITILQTELAHSGAYLNSAHGNSTNGVKRSAAGFPADYTTGLCAHCHETHASIDGAEPSPVAGNPSDYTLFYDNYTNQTDSICYECHRDLNSYQTGGLINRSYSYRAGGWNADSLNDILEAFSYTSPDSSHSLNDIRTFITGKWGYTADSNPCNACHNPHAAQGDPLGAPNNAKSSGSRGWPVSRPSQHSNDNNAWGLLGDDIGEKMSDYPGTYQAPYRYNSTTAFEPDGSATQDGSNLADFATFCSDCHNNTNTIYSTALGRNLYTFNWQSTEKHGGGAAGDACVDLFLPYQEATCGTYTLTCTDCHEPHGSPNIFLIRRIVNSGSVTVDTGTGLGPDGRNGKEWVYLCGQCHNATGAIPINKKSRQECRFNCDALHPPSYSRWNRRREQSAAIKTAFLLK